MSAPATPPDDHPPPAPPRPAPGPVPDAPSNAELVRAVHAAVLAALPSPADAGPEARSARGARLGAELARFRRLMRAYPERGGKRLRALLLLHATRAHGAPWRAGLPAAAGLELFQNWVLVHDDIEDDSEERRGAPALHREVGVPVALNVGDAVHVRMWRLLLEAPLARRDEVLGEFLRLIDRTAEGQHLDLAWVESGRLDVSEEDYLRMATLKTAWYTVAGPLRLGALCADREPDPRLEGAGLDLGIAFQIRDDVLNLSPGATTGKEFAGDLFEAKRTLILAHLFAHAAPAEADEVRARLSAPRAERGEDDVERVLGLIERHGSLRYAQEVADARAARGLARLREVLAGLPDQRAARELAGLVESVARRHE